jgi:CheY-like chemotaxis protein
LGAKFVVSLPLNAIRSVEDLDTERPIETGDPVAQTPPLDSLAGIKVLIVDDEPDAREMVKRLLEDYGAVVSASSCAREAFERMAIDKPAVVVSDIGMPEEDGYALMRRIRALSPEQGGETPAVALTAYARLEDRDRCILAGFQAHLAKPVEPADLIALVSAVAGKAPRSIQEAPNHIASPLAKVSAKPLNILVVEDHEGTRAVLTKLLHRRRHTVTAVSSITEARIAAEQAQFDLVISDLGLPDGSGNLLMAELRSRFGLKGVALSGYGDASALSESFQAGFITHLTKPVSIAALETAMTLAITTPAK